MESGRLLSLKYCDEDWAQLQSGCGDVVRLETLRCRAVHLFHPDDFITVCAGLGPGGGGRRRGCRWEVWTAVMDRHAD